MANKKIISLFRKECKMSNQEWYCFCSRYSKRNIKTVLSCINAFCHEFGFNDFKANLSFEKDLREELNKSLLSPCGN